MIIFQSTRPLRGATRRSSAAFWPAYFNPRAPCGARRLRPDLRKAKFYFNPRAPCGARLAVIALSQLSRSISIHAPLAGRDQIQHDRADTAATFQSTRPLRGATGIVSGWAATGLFQSTRPLRGATSENSPGVMMVLFQSTRPLRGATSNKGRDFAAVLISIHAPLAGRDNSVDIKIVDNCHFNPRAPCGARLILQVIISLWGSFQSTRPLRGATRSRVFAGLGGLHFNPRAPCGARLQMVKLPQAENFNFNPRAPCGARRRQDVYGDHARHFNPRAPCGARQQI